MSDGSKTRSRGKRSQKPYAGFPLTPHRGTGRWCKKIPQSAPRDAGKLYYFGKIEDGWKPALERYNREWPFIIDGREVPPPLADEFCTVRVLCNEFLNSKRAALGSGELSHRTFADYYRTCERLVNHFGADRRVDDLRPADFEDFRTAMAKAFGVVTLKNEINRCRVVFKYAADNRLIDQPVHYGSSFAKPAAKLIRRARNEAGPRMFEADELRRILDALAGAPVTLNGKDEPETLKPDPFVHAMTLLGVNCGFGNTDVANLQLRHVDLESGWCSFPRPKTEIHRRVPLWPETVDALRVAIAKRPKPIDRADADCVFITRQGRRWVRVQESATTEDAVLSLDALAQRFARRLEKLGINGRRGFYALRHTFETIGGESRDQVAVNAIMGHVDSSMAGVYRERISDERLRAVVETVRAWLWPPVETCLEDVY